MIARPTLQSKGTIDPPVGVKQDHEGFYMMDPETYERIPVDEPVALTYHPGHLRFAKHEHLTKESS